MAKQTSRTNQLIVFVQDGAVNQRKQKITGWTRGQDVGGHRPVDYNSSRNSHHLLEARLAAVNYTQMTYFVKPTVPCDSAFERKMFWYTVANCLEVVQQGLKEKIFSGEFASRGFAATSTIKPHKDLGIKV